MSQRDSGYERKERDLYETPEWVTRALLPHIREDVHRIWEPATGNSKMANVFKEDFDVIETDIATGVDFLTCSARDVDAIITNPPYEFAQSFIQRALGQAPLVAMLLRTDFDHAKTRAHLFAEHRFFAKKVVLTKRIKWFEDSAGSPSFNHAWFIWDYQHKGPPTLAYGP